MTLNITVAARWLMAQSSDFRLTHEVVDRKTGHMKVVVDSDVSQKQVVLHYVGWSGLVCYTGVAKYGSHDTASWVEKVLGHDDGGQRSPAHIVRLLTERGSVWLRKILPKDRRHTFTMITYEMGKPHVYVISNFERPGQLPHATPADELFLHAYTTKSTALHSNGLVHGGHRGSATDADRRAGLRAGYEGSERSGRPD